MVNQIGDGMALKKKIDDTIEGEKSEERGGKREEYNLASTRREPTATILF